MAAISPLRSCLDRPAVIQKIREIFAQSSVLRDAQICDPHSSGGGKVWMDVRFGQGPVLFRVVAPTPEKAYAVLYELASALVEAERNFGDRPGVWGND